MTTTRTYTDISLADVDHLRRQPGACLVDVRDEWEFDEFNIGGINVPLADIRSRKSELASYQTLLVVCTNGVRSRVAAKDFLRQPEFADKLIYHLQGGLVEAED